MQPHTESVGSPCKCRPPINTPINIMQIIDTLKDNHQLVKIEIGSPDKAGAKNLQTICIAEEGSIDWDYFEDLAKAQGKVIVDSYVEA